MLYNMPQKVKVSGSRPLRKGSRKNSKKGSKKGSKRHAGLDFTSILNDMTNNEVMQQQQNPMAQNPMANMMQQNPMAQQMMQQQMGQNPMGNMMMPNAFGNMMGDMSSMMGNMMMGNNNTTEIDPLHIQQLIPQGQNLNINNYGISVDQLNSGEQNTGLSNRFNGMGAQMQQQMPQQMQQRQQ